MRIEGIEAGGAAGGVARVFVFPLHRRMSTVNRAVEAMLAQPTIERQDRMRHRISEILFGALANTGLDDDAQDEAVGAFFSVVDRRLEVAELDKLLAVPGE